MEEPLLIRGGHRDSRPLLIKLGFALAFSIAAYFASQFRSTPRKLYPPKFKSPSDDGGLKESTSKSPAMAACGLRDGLQILSSEEALAKIINGTSSMNTEKGFLMPQSNEIIMSEFEANPEIDIVNLANNKELKIEEREEMEKEIADLRNLVEALKERERSLEIQLTEYHELKAQVASLRELENRLKANAMESKLLNLKIESLQADNQKWQAQVSDYPRVVSELEAAREEIKILKNRLKIHGEQAQEKLAALREKIMGMIDKEREHVEDDLELERKLKKLKELEDEVMALRNVNSRLAKENLKFAELMGSAKVAACCESDQCNAQALEEARRLKEENKELKEEIEQLQMDRCADVEELVYLRWVNACLRYELRNYQPPAGKTVARDLSRCLSPESEKRAKQLILEYAKSDANVQNISLFDFDTESCSSSQASSDEYSDTSIAASSSKNSSARKSKVISKLKKLVLGKDSHKGKADFVDRTPTSLFESHPNDQLHIKPGRSPGPLRPSLDVQRMRKLELEAEESIAERSRSDVGTSRGHIRVISEDCSSELSHNLEHEDGDVPEQTKLKKFANALKGLHGPLKVKKRHGSFD